MKKQFEAIKSSYLWWPFFISLSIFLIDQITKFLIVSNTNQYLETHLIPPVYIIITHFFEIVDVRNRGAAWGIFQGQTNLLGFVSLAAFLYLVYDFKELTENNKYKKIFMATLIGGVVGNLVDRFFRGEVVDFLQFYIVDYAYPSFNIADMAICAGTFCYLFFTIFEKKKVPESKELPNK